MCICINRYQGVKFSLLDLLCSLCLFHYGLFQVKDLAQMFSGSCDKKEFNQKKKPIEEDQPSQVADPLKNRCYSVLKSDQAALIYNQNNKITVCCFCFLLLGFKVKLLCFNKSSCSYSYQQQFQLVFSSHVLEMLFFCYKSTLWIYQYLHILLFLFQKFLEKCFRAN